MIETTLIALILYSLTTAQTTSIGQALLFVVIAGIGFILNRKSKQIHVLVNSRLDEALSRIAQLENSLGIGKGAPVPPREHVVLEIKKELEAANES